MYFWRVTIADSVTGQTNLNDPIWIVATFGGTTSLEILRQIKEVKESVSISNNGPSKFDMIGKEFDVNIIEFDAMGVARL